MNHNNKIIIVYFHTLLVTDKLFVENLFGEDNKGKLSMCVCMSA